MHKIGRPRGELSERQHERIEKQVADRLKREGIYRKGAESLIRRRLDKLAKRDEPAWEEYIESHILEREMGRLRRGEPESPDAASYVRRMRSIAHPLAPGAGLRISKTRNRLIRKLESGRYGPRKAPLARQAILHLGRDLARYAAMAEARMGAFAPTPERPIEARIAEHERELNSRYSEGKKWTPAKAA